MEKGSYIQIASGLIFDPLNPDTSKITINDIAHSLANQCRFNGHVQRFYSVAEHSVHVSRVAEGIELGTGGKALIHDAQEFGLGDLPSPLKHSEYGAEYVKAEDALQVALFARFGLSPDIPVSVSVADKAMLQIERLQLLPRTNEGDELWAEWDLGDSSFVPEYCWPQCWPPEVAKTIFLERAREVGLL